MSHHFWRAAARLSVASLLALGLLMIVALGPVLAEPPAASNQQEESPTVCRAYPIMIPASSFSGGISPGEQVFIQLAEAMPAPGVFSFLAWDNSAVASIEALADSLLHPERVATDFVEPNSLPPDTILNAEDWIWAATGVWPSVPIWNTLNSLIGVEMLLPVWNDGDCLPLQGCSNAIAQGINLKYRTYTFVSMKLLQVHSTGSPKGLTFQFNYFTPGEQTTPCPASASEPPPVGNLDTALVLDYTGSMEYDTICYGCWARCGDTGTSSDVYSADYRYYLGNNALLIPTFGTEGCTAADRYQPYPANGRKFPYNYDSTMMQSLITGNSLLPGPVDWNGDGDFFDTDEDYIMLEAEFYTRNSSSWEPAFRTAGQGYWAIQRNWGAKAFSVDGYGYAGSSFSGYRLSGAVRHHPYSLYNGSPALFGHYYTLTEAANGEAPALDYEFFPTWSGDTYIYIRAQGIGSSYGGTPVGQFYWNVVNSGGDPQTAVATAAASTSPINNWVFYSGPLADAWTWVKLGPISLTSNQLYRLRIYAGQPGLGLDRILVTRQNINPITSYLTSREATPGSARGLASDPCNPIFGKSVLPTDCNPYGGGRTDVTQPINNLNDPLFNGMEPIRGMQQAASHLLTDYLDPQVDQAGLVSFAYDAQQRSQLECLRSSRSRASAGSQINDYPLNAATYGEYDELTCFDQDTALPGTRPISFTNVLIPLEDMYPPSGATDIADGLRRGLHLLGINTDNDDATAHSNDCDWTTPSTWWRLRTLNASWLNQPGPDSKSNPIVSHCGRGEAATGLIMLITDGAPNDSTPGDNLNCNVEPSPLPYADFPTTANTSDIYRVKNYNCIIYYADIAAANHVPICAVGLGTGADIQLLQAITERSGGQAFAAMNPAYLDLPTFANACLAGRGADLAVSASPPTQVVEAGQSISYTLVSSNIGPLRAVSATLVNTWTPTAAVTSAAAPGCAVDVTGGTITCPYADLPLLSPVSLPVTLTLRSDFSGTLTSQAEITSTAGLPDNRPENNNAIVQFSRTLLYLPVIFKEIDPTR